MVCSSLRNCGKSHLTVLLGNARVFGLEEGLHLKDGDFANLTSLYYVTYVIFEIPWVLAVHKFGANKVISIAIVTWSIVVLGTGFTQNYIQALVCRLLLGLTEAGLFPGLSFFISTLYPREIQAKRLAVMYGSIALSGAFGGLIAYGIQIMGDRLGISAWRWLFIIEGAISIAVGLVCWFSLPKASGDAWFLNDKEKEFLRHRKAVSDAMHGHEGLTWSYIHMAFTDPIVYVAGICLFCAGLPLFGFGTFLPTIIKGLGYVK